MRVALSLTHRCNLACRYCYSGRPLNADMALPTACRIVDFAAAVDTRGEPVTCYFFGGEPLLCFELMQEITRYVRLRQRAVGRLLHLSITTNGTLLDQRVLDFLREERISLCVSIDGPEHVHNRNRVFRNGLGSFSQVERKLGEAIAQLPDVQVNAVYGPDTLDSLPETVSFLAETGAAAVHLNPDIRATWSTGACSRLRDIYSQIADYYIRSYLAGREIAVNLIDSKVVVLLNGGYQPSDLCQMGEAEWGFAPSGNVYPCERFIGEDNTSELCLGNIHTGLDLQRRCALLKLRGNRNEECLTCRLRRYCKNNCGCTNYHTSGYTDVASQMVCQSERAAIQAAAKVLRALKESDLFFDHYLEHLHRGRRRTSQQPVPL